MNLNRFSKEKVLGATFALSFGLIALFGVLNQFDVPLVSEVSAAPPSETLTVTIFQDTNGNGSLDVAETDRIDGVTVSLFGADSGATAACATAATNLNGTATFAPADTVTCTGEVVRVEVNSADYPAGLLVGPVNTVDDDADASTSTYEDSATDASPIVQMVDLSSPQTINISVINPAEYTCSAADAYLFVPCYINGDPLIAGGAADMDAFVGFPYTATGSAFDPQDPANPDINVVEPDHLAVGSQIGSTWGVAYSRQQQLAFTAAFLKRHVGLGPLGLDGIYAVDMSDGGPSATVANWLEVEVDLGVDIGVSLVDSNPDRGLDASTDPSHDAGVFDSIATIGLGDIDIVDDELLDPDQTRGDGWVDHEYLFLVDVANKDVLVVDTVDKNLVTTYDIPAPTTACVNGEHRPWAINYHEGSLYVGLICDGSTDTANLLNEGPNSNLEAIVYEYDVVAELRSETPPAAGTAAPVTILREPLDYARGPVWKESNCPVTSSWHPWLDSSNPHPLGTDVPLFGPDDIERERICWPTPILSDLEFSDDGNMLLSFMDRSSHQWGFFNYGLDETDDQTLYELMAGGDVLMACPDNTGTFILEDDGECGGLVSNSDPANAQGPGGREFFYGDGWYFEIDSHNETANAGLAVLPGASEVVVAGMNPWQNDYYSSGGVNWFNTTNGDPRAPGYMLFASVNTSSPTAQPGTQGKAGGLGDLEAICPAIPQQMGDFVWFDMNQNGVQDPGEQPLEGVTVHLQQPNGTFNTTTTDANGFYLFNVDNRTDYTLGFDASTSTTTLPGGASAQDLVPTKHGLTSTTSLNDSDLSPTETVTVNGDELPSATFTSGNPGNSDHTVDAGFALTYDLALVVILESGQSPNVTLNEIVDYEIIVKNQSSTNSGAFTTTVEIPAGMSLDTVTGTNWTTDAQPGDVGTIVLTFNGDLPPDATSVIQLGLSVDDVTDAPFRVWAEISADSSGDFGTTDEDSVPDTDTGSDAGPGSGDDPNDLVDNHNDIDLDEPPNDEDDNDFEDVVINLIYDLALIKTLATGQPALVATDATVNYVITVANQGNVPSNEIVVTDQIPTGMSLASAAGAGWSCPAVAGATGSFDCTHSAGLAPDVQTTIAVALTIDDASNAPFRNWAEISDDSAEDYATTDEDSTPDTNVGDDNGPDFGDDPNDEYSNHNDIDLDDPANDEDDNDYEDVGIDANYDLALINILAPGQSPQVGQDEDVTFNLIVGNQGNVPSGVFTVTNQIPEGLSFVSITGTNWTTTAQPGDTGEVIFVYQGDLPPGDTSTVEMVLRVDDPSQAEFRDWAEISDDSSEDYNTTDEDSTPDGNVGNDDGPGVGQPPNDDVDNHDDISLDEPPGDEDDNDYAEITIASRYDLSLVKVLANGQAAVVSVNDVVNYNIVVMNQGNVDSNDFVVTDQIPAGMSFAAAAGTDWTCPASAGDTGAIACSFGGSLAPSEKITLSLSLRVDSVSNAPFRNWAEISENSADDYGTTDEDSTPDTNTGSDDAPGLGTSPNDDVDNHNDVMLDEPANDEDDNDYEDVDVMVMYDLALVKSLFSGQASNVALGDQVSYLIRVQNQGTVNSGDFTVRDTIPGGMSYVSGSGIDWTCGASAGDTGNVICTFGGDLNPGDETLLTLRLSVDDASKQPFRNWAEIASDSSGDFGVNDKDSVPNDNNGSDPDAGDGGTGSDPVIDHDDIEHDDPAYDDPTEDEDDSDYEDITTAILLELGDLVWHDVDNDGLYEPNDGEIGLDNVAIELLDSSGNVIRTTTTANGGKYLFSNLPEGQYQVRIPTPPASYPASSGPTDMTDSRINNDDNGDQATEGGPTLGPIVTLTPNQEPTNDGDTSDLSDLTIDFGFYDPTDGTTAVTLIAFTGTSVDKTVALAWETGTEIDNFGFYLVRTRTPVMPVDPDLRAALGPVLTKVEGGTGQGDTYTFTDTVDEYGVYYYWLVDVETDGDVNIEEQPVRITTDRFRRYFLPIASS